MSLTGVPDDKKKPSTAVRAEFLDYFRARGHDVQASAPLVPRNDPTLMFTNAGMVPFKDVFTGKETRSYKRACSAQKCIRISGKHNDLENVGVTARHHTFFEMLGNFSFGDYFKEEAIAYAWELLTKGYGLPKERLLFTVFGGEPGLPADDEARALWKKIADVGDERVVGLSAADNFWQMGETGPCGPCTEVQFYLGELDGGVPRYALFGEEPAPDGTGWVEVWNLVFMQFERSLIDGVAKLTPLPAPCVDTGMGLERITSVIQGVTSNYDTDLLRALVDETASIAGKPYRASTADDDVSMRVVADHARTTAFLLAEGIFPDRDGREYVLRRVMRRAIRHGHRLGIRQPFLHRVALRVVAEMGGAYPELAERRDLIASVTEQEEVRFRETIERGLKILDDEVSTMRARGETRIPGDVAFKLYDTYGFPLDLTQVIARERDLSVDDSGYERALEAQRARSAGSKVGDEAVEAVWHTVEKSGVRFTGYDAETGEGRVVAIVRAGALVDRANEGDEVAVATDASPFYGEAGGQVGDQGKMTTAAAELVVRDTQKPVTGVIAHIGKVTRGSIAVGDVVKLEVDHALRTATRRNHSATHLLHWALRTVLGETATQKGSRVGPDRLRFDFAHGKALAADEIERIEDLVNEKVLGDAPVLTEVLPIGEAKKRGAMAIFEEKYGDVVRVLTMTKDSVELCGGTHARALGEIGLFKIVSDAALAAGVRRIEAVTGLNALAHLRHVEEIGKHAAATLGVGLSQLVERADKLVAEKRTLEREIADLKRKVAMGGGGVEDHTKSARDIPGGKALAVRADMPDAAALRELAERLRDKLGSAVVLVGAASSDKAMLVLTVSKDLTDRYKAGDLIKGIAQIVGGSGGGRPDMAQAGGTDITKLDEALASLYARLG
jgi:alanyl-tRNA synthetase